MYKNVAGQKVGAQLVDASDGSAFTGAVTAYVTGDAGTQAAGSVSAGACTHEGNGYHTYAPAQAETNYDLVAVTFIGTGAVPATVQIYTRPGDVYARLGAPAGASIAADIAGVQSDMNDIQTRLPAALVSGRMDASVGAMAANVVTAAATAADYVTEVQGAAAAAITAAALATAAAVDDLPTNAELATALAAADDAVLARLGAPAGASIAADIANISAGSGPTAVEIANEVQTRTIAAVTVVNGLAANVITAASLAADAGTEIRSGLATTAQLGSVRLSSDGVNDILRSALPEGYADNGEEFTLAQALYMLWSLANNRRVQADVLRTYGLDGTTQVMTFLLDDVTAPTEQIRQS